MTQLAIPRPGTVVAFCCNDVAASLINVRLILFYRQPTFAKEYDIISRKVISEYIVTCELLLVYLLVF